MNIWKTIKKPIFALAPMYEVTDVVFREIVYKACRPDIFYTEFVNCDGLSGKGHEHFISMLKYTSNQRPIIAQIWGANPETYKTAASIVSDLGFDGIDINMGCPQKPEMKIGACAALIGNHTLTEQVIANTISGGNGLPVSVKTRIGINSIETDSWIKFLLGTGISALTIHGRLAKDMSNVPANWNEIAKGVAMRNEMKSECVILGNGDILNKSMGHSYISKYGVDGVMIGRGIFGNLFAFSETDSEQSKIMQLKLLVEHLSMFEKEFPKRQFPSKFYKVYTKNMDNAKEIKETLANTPTIKQAISEVNELITKLS